MPGQRMAGEMETLEFAELGALVRGGQHHERGHCERNDASEG